MSRVTTHRWRNKSRQLEHREDHEDLPDGAAPRRRRRRRLFIAGLLLGTLIWFAPGLVAHTGLLAWGLANASADLNGKLIVRSASLGWISPVKVREIEVRDAQDEIVLQAEKLTSGKSLAGILWDISKPGHFRIEKPKLSVVLRKDGSNLEDLLAKYIQPSDEPPARTAGFDLEIVDGSVSVTDQDSERSWQLEGLQLKLRMPADASKPIEVETSATVADPQRPGRLEARLSMQQPGVDAESSAAGGESSAAGGEANVSVDAVPLAMFQPLVCRFVSETQLDGRLAANVQAQWGEKNSLRADVSTDALVLATAALGTDKLQVERLHAVAQITQHGDRVEVGELSLDCELGYVSAAGTLQLGKGWVDRLPDSALKQTCKIEGRVDLARLAEMLPETLRIRKQTQITSGRVQLAVSSSPDSAGMVWQGRVEAAKLTAVDRGRQIAWEQPILITLAAHDTVHGPVVDELKCTSDFLKIHGAGTPDDLAASVSFSLKQMADQLGQFVELGGLQLAGDGWGHFNWKRDPQQKFQADAEVQLRNFQLAVPDGQTLSEENLLLFLSATGRTDLGSDTQLHGGTLKVRTESDRVEVKLTQPVLDLRGGGTWPVELDIHGQLQRWPPRIRSWLPLDDWSMAGDYHLTGQVTASADGATAREVKLNVAGLKLAGPSLNIDEPNVELTVSGGWSQQQRKLHIEPGSLSAGSLLVEARGVALAMPADGPLSLAGRLKYRGDIQRLSQWFAEKDTPPKSAVAGEFAGTANVQQTGDLIAAQIDADVVKLSVTGVGSEPFREPRVHLVASGDYHQQTGVLRLEQANLTSSMMGLDAKGRIATAAAPTPNKRTTVQLDGQVQYDLEKLAGLLRPYIGSEIQIGGSGSGPISYNGPLVLAEAKAGAAVGWDWANAYGFQVGPGRLKAKLAAGILQAEPVEVAVSRGRMVLAPRLQLSPEPMELTLPPGPLAQQVQITPAMCDNWLKYIAPVMADVTTARGGFSIELEDCRIPLGDPARGDVSGRFIIHSVEIGPGPLVQELAVLMGRAVPASLRRESVVPFRMVEGRVYHQGLELQFPELTIRTHGSVGLDQTLSIMAEMPVPPKWIGNNPIGDALRKQTVKIPIAGTLSKPRLDQRELSRISAQFIENAARNVIGEEVGRQLERLHDLFGPPR